MQQTPSVEERLDAAIAASQVEQSETIDAPSRKVAPMDATQRASVRATTPAPVAAQPERTPAQQTRPEAAVHAMPVASVPTAAPTPAQPTPAESQLRSTDPALLWALGGGALILLGLGGAALMRRGSRVQYEDIPTEEAAFIAPPERVAPPPAPVETLQPEPAPLATAASTQERRLEAMVAAPPSRENPFRTYSKRMTRAKFLLARQNARSAPASFQEAAPAAPAPPITHPTQPTQTVYRFGSDRGRKNLFNPRTS
ncbi:hypothetical protein [Sphingobium sp.]|uniref:hypothetical protein n=1 Tax=Sphingobium sp. TaxID=1912891 RepID=UPI0035C6F13F